MKAILSSTIMPLDGIYSVKTVSFDEVKDLIKGVPHYVGHPDTKNLLESLGATPAPSKKFEGLQPNEACLCVPLVNNERKDGFTIHQGVTDYSQLAFRVLTRIS